MLARLPLLLSAMFLALSACNKNVTAHGIPDSALSAEDNSTEKNLAEEAVIIALQDTEGPLAFVRNESTQKWRVLSEEEQQSFLNTNILLKQLKTFALLEQLKKQTQELQSLEVGQDELQKKLVSYSDLRDRLEQAELEYRSTVMPYITPNGVVEEKSQSMSWVLHGDKNSDPKKTARIFSLDEVRAAYMQVHIHLQISLDLLKLKENSNASAADKAQVKEEQEYFSESLQKLLQSSLKSKDELLTDFSEKSPWLPKE